MQAERPHASIWHVMRCHPSKTLTVDSAFADLGAVTYVPTVVELKRHHRRRKPTASKTPLIPGLIFLAGESCALGVPSPPNTAWPLLLPLGGIMRVRDVDLNGLAEIEAEAALKKPAQPSHNFRFGQTVSINEGPFSGLRGRVRSCAKSHILLDIDGFSGGFRISPLLLSANHGNKQQSQ